MKHFSRLSLFLVPLVGFAALSAAQAQIRIPINPGKPKSSPSTPATPVDEKPVPIANWRPTVPQIEMVKIPGGSFLMGSPASEEGRADNEGPQHRVTVPGFSIGKYEVTQAQWRAVMGTNPPRMIKGDDLPIEQVSWDDAKEFCLKLSQMTGKAYRLPTEAEWEYAARAGATGAFAGEVKATAWCGAGAKGTGWGSHPVGQKKANAFGLHDMQGNLYEWCEDIGHSNYKGAPTDGSAWLSGGDSNLRVARGGSWLLVERFCRLAVRVIVPANTRDFVNGFRVALGASRQ